MRYIPYMISLTVINQTNHSNVDDIIPSPHDVWGMTWRQPTTRPTAQRPNGPTARCEAFEDAENSRLKARDAGAHGVPVRER